VNPHALNALRAWRRESILMLQAPRLALHGGTATVQSAPLVRVSRDARVVSAPLDNGEDLLLGLDATQRNDRSAIAFLALGVDAAVVITLVGGERRGAEARACTASKSGATYSDS
jgi:hypothetical protein